MKIDEAVSNAEPVPDPLPQSRYLGDKPVETPPALVKGMLPQTGVAPIVGQSGTGKSFHAIHLGLCLMPDTEQNFYIDRYRIKRKGGVLYFVLEGKPAFPLRVAAALDDMMGKQMKLGDKNRLPFAWNPYSPNLFANGPDALIRIAEREALVMRRDFGVDLVAIYVDTLGLAALFENEDKSSQINKVYSGLGQLSDVTGALVIPVDHMGKDQDRGPRGSSAKRDHPETCLTCLVDKDANGKSSNHRMVLYKIRDGEEGRIIPYRLHVVPRGVDEDGDQVTTCTIRREPDRQPPTKVKAPPPRSKTDSMMDMAIADVGGLPAEMVALRDAFYKRHAGSQHAANTAWLRTVKKRLVTQPGGKLDEKPGSPF